jgi:hypothetical protein
MLEEMYMFPVRKNLPDHGEISEGFGRFLKCFCAESIKLRNL